MKMKEQEVYEAIEDGVDNFDVLNEVYRSTWDWIKQDHIEKSDVDDILKDDLNPLKRFQALQMPYEELKEEVSYSIEYKERETDPLERLANLKVEIIDVQKELEEYGERFKENEFIKETDNYEKLFNDLEIYKGKIDAFINYDIYNKLEENDNDVSQGSNESLEKKKEFQSLYEKYNRITENLISQIKSNENNLLRGVDEDFLIRYEIIANPEAQIETLNQRLVDLEDKLSTMEKVIGNWDQYNHNESISFCLTKLMNSSASKLQERYEKKYQIFKDCGNLINSFIEKKKDKIEKGSYFLKIKEIYSVLELYEHFEQVFEYVKRRMSALKEIFDSSDQFISTLEEIQNRITKNEKKFSVLIDKYDSVLKLFDEFQQVLNDLSTLDNEIKDIIV